MIGDDARIISISYVPEYYTSPMFIRDLDSEGVDDELHQLLHHC